jgi:hypothetical protein
MVCGGIDKCYGSVPRLSWRDSGVWEDTFDCMLTGRLRVRGGTTSKSVPPCYVVTFATWILLADEKEAHKCAAAIAACPNASGSGRVEYGFAGNRRVRLIAYFSL